MPKQKNETKIKPELILLLIDEFSMKGRGMWSSTAHYAPWHIEGGKGTPSKMVHFQLRPHPLAE